MILEPQISARTQLLISPEQNTHLWNPTGVYSLSRDAPSNFSLTAIAWTILSGTANASQTTSMISKLPSLRLGIGYKTNLGDGDSQTTPLSPNMQRFLLEALFKAHRDLGVHKLTVARTLLDDFWAQMVTQDPCSQQSVNQIIKRLSALFDFVMRCCWSCLTVPKRRWPLTD